MNKDLTWREITFEYLVQIAAASAYTLDDLKKLLEKRINRLVAEGQKYISQQAGSLGDCQIEKTSCDSNILFNSLIETKYSHSFQVYLDWAARPHLCKTLIPYENECLSEPDWPSIVDLLRDWLDKEISIRGSELVREEIREKNNSLHIFSSKDRKAFKPDHYFRYGFDTFEFLIQKGHELEEYFKKNDGPKPTTSTEAVFAILNALKYLIRIGQKDDVYSELAKIENYIHRARTGEWLTEKEEEV